MSDTRQYLPISWSKNGLGFYLDTIEPAAPSPGLESSEESDTVMQPRIYSSIADPSGTLDFQSTQEPLLTGPGGVGERHPRMIFNGSPCNAEVHLHYQLSVSDDRQSLTDSSL